MQTMRAVRIVMAIRAAMPANAVPTVHVAALASRKGRALEGAPKKAEVQFNVAALASRKGRALEGAPKKAEVQFTFVYNSPPVPRK